MSTPYIGSPTGSSWSAATPRHCNDGASGATPSTSGASSSRQLMLAPQGRPARSLLRQEVLTEDEYTQAVSDIIKRDFFPALHELDAKRDLARVLSESSDATVIAEHVARVRALVTPTPRPRKRRKVNAEPGETPYGSEAGGETPLAQTPESSIRGGARRSAASVALPPSTRYDGTLSLDAFQQQYTSEDNASFAEILAKNNAQRRERFAWAYTSADKTTQRAIEARENRERLVEMTRRMVESDPDGQVKMLDGPAGKPGERRLLAPDDAQARALTGTASRLAIAPSAASTAASNGQRLIEGASSSSSTETLMLPPSAPPVGAFRSADEIDRSAAGGRAKARGAEDVGERDMDEVDDVAPGEQQTHVEGWPFTVRNSLMFGPDANRGAVQGQPDAAAEAAERGGEGGDEGGQRRQQRYMGEPKGIRRDAIRFFEQKAGSSDGPASPTRSHIAAAISGTPYPAQKPSATPQVRGYGFVDAMPSPNAASMAPAELDELMTWGTIEGTPIAVRSGQSPRDKHADDNEWDDDEAAERARRAREEEEELTAMMSGKFHMPANRRREELAHKMAHKSSRSLREQAFSHGRSGSDLGLRASVLGGGARGGTPGSGAGRTPMSPRGGEGLSPAAQRLLGRTASGSGSATAAASTKSRGTPSSKGSTLAEQRVAARAKEREMERRRAQMRWTPTPL